MRRRIDDRRGAVALIFALSASLLFFSIAVAVEFSRVLAARTELQNAVDAAAIVGEAPGAGVAKARRMERAFEGSLLGAPLEDVAFVLVREDGVILIEARGVLKSHFAGAFGREHFEIRARRTARSRALMRGQALFTTR